MKILVFSQYYYPEPFLIHEITEELVNAGHSVTVVTGLPNYPSGVIPAEYKKRSKRNEMINGVHVIRCPVIPRGHNTLQLLLNYISYMISASIRSRNLKGFDVVYSYQLTPITQVYPAVRYCRKNRLRLFLYNCDPAPMSGDRTASKSKLFFKCYAGFSKRIMNSCDLIGVTSKSFIKYNHEINAVPLEKMVYLPQHASGQMLNMDISSADNGITDFMFAGNLGGGAGLDTIVKAADMLKKRGYNSFCIHFVGDGSYLPELKRLVTELDLDRQIVFHGRKNRAEMPDMYKLADALLITLRKDQITVPGKLQMYMTTGKPVFGAMDSSGREMISESGCGKCVPAEDHVALAEIMEDYMLYPERYSGCGDAARRFYSESFTLTGHMRSLIRQLSRLQIGR